METALYTMDNRTYTANDFGRLPDLDQKRRFLACTECNGPAYFRRASRNGREACFGARPHAEGCTLAALEHDGTPTGQGDIQDEIITTGQRIVIDFNYGAVATVPGAQGARGQADNGTGRAYTGEDTTIRDITTRRLGPLLQHLIVSEEFRNSDQIIEVPDQGEFVARDLFINVGNVTEEHIGQYHCYWGMVPDARIFQETGTLWFNSGGRGDMSVLLDQRYIADVYERFNIEDVEDIVGAYILVFGDLRLSAKNKKYVQITAPDRFTLRLA